MSFTTTKINNITVRPLNKKIQKQRSIPDPFPDPVSGTSEPFVFVYSAKIGSGKSVNLSNLLLIYQQYFRKVFFCSANIETDNDNRKVIKDLAYRDRFRFAQDRLYDKFNDSVMQDILDEIKATKDETDYDPEDDHFLIIVDDLSQAFLAVKSLITKTILRTRHIKLSWIITTQRFRNINPAIRGQITYFVSFLTQNKKEIEAMSEVVDVSPEQYKKLLDFCTADDHGFLYIDSSKNPPKFYKGFSDRIEVS
jgi:hypothetical protein